MALALESASTTHQIIQYRVEEITRKISLVTEKLFQENQDTPQLIEERYTINLLEFSTDQHLTKLFLKAIGFPNTPPLAVEAISQRSELKQLMREVFIPVLSEHSFLPQQVQMLSLENLQVFIKKLSSLRSVLRTPGNHEECLQLHHQIRFMLLQEKVLHSPFYAINEDLKKSLFLTQVEILKSVHQDLGGIDWGSDIPKWESELSRMYSKSSPIEQTLKYQVQTEGNIPRIFARLPNLSFGEISISFDVLPIQIKYLKEFSLKEPQKPILIPLEKFSLKPHKDCNCMSFAVGRKGPGIVTPNGEGTTPNRISQFHKELIENGCINVESITSNNIEHLTGLAGENNPVYLTAFVFDSGGSETAPADFHVYRCFFDQERSSPIWMELAQAKGGIQFSKIGGVGDLVYGIPANPQGVFCKDNWKTFAGYWLIPPEASFEIKLKNPDAYIFNKATFVRFIS